MYSLSEAQEIVRRNRDSQDKFLSGKRKEGLDRLFGGRGAGGKLKIEIGLQTLKLTKKEARKTKTGGDMIVLSFYKPPIDSSFKKTKDSYDLISCYHILGGYGTGDIEEDWFKSFTTCFTAKDFDHIKKGDSYLCLVKHTEEYFIKDGEYVTYEKGINYQKPIIVIKPSIVKVYPIGTENIEVNYFKLFEPLKNV